MAGTTRTMQLEALAKQLPVANQKIATGLDEARKTQMAEAIRQARPGVGSNALAAGMGAQAAAASGAAAVSAAEQTGNRLQLVGQMGLQEQSRAARQAAFEQGIQESRVGRALGDKLNNISREAKKTILDDNLRFKMDESGRALLNITQLTDWAAQNASSQEDLASKMQAMSQVHDRKIQMLQSAAARLEQLARNGYYSDRQKMDATSRKNILERSLAIKAQVEREQNVAASRAARNRAVGMAGGALVGGVVGSVVPVIGPAVGVAAGSAIGGGAAAAYTAASPEQQKLFNTLAAPGLGK